MSVTRQHPEYQANIARWQLVEDCVAGSDAVKERKQKYLPKPNANDKSKDNEDRYNAYVKRAQFVNFTGRTKKALIGAVFRNQPQIELPEALSYIEEDANREGISLINSLKLTCGEILETGRAGLLADYPQAEEGLTLSETQQNKAYVVHYDAKRVINWHVSQSGMLDLVVLRESEEVQEGTEFEYVTEPRYRVLIMVDGVYQQWYYDDGGFRVWAATPRKADGTTFNEIPWSWIGAEDNDETVDEGPLYDIADINIGHYRNSADYEESAFMVGQPTPVVTGLTSSWVEQNQGEYIIGSQYAWQLPEGADAKLMQAEPNQMPEQAMKNKEQQMVGIGARIIQDGTGAETAEAARIRHSGENSMLVSIVENLEAAYKRVLGFVADFMGANREQVDIVLNREFFDSKLSAQEVAAIIQLGDARLVSTNDQRDMLRSGRIGLDAERDNDDIDSDIAGQGFL